MTWLLVLGLTIAVAPACRQVLGLEEAKAKVEAEPGAAGSPAEAKPKPSGFLCETGPADACQNCLRECDDVDDFAGTCGSNDECLAALRTYDECIGPSCAGDKPDQQENCVFGLPAKQRTCASRCLTACEGTKLVSECVLYCTCMQDQCSSVPGEPSVPFNECMNKCNDPDTQPELTSCRLDHCGLVYQQTDAQVRTRHCQHASGTINICERTLKLTASERNFCLDKNPNFWACDKDTDCCSENCDRGACEPSP